MEKFAVDLDKVLDDFELDEDENESATQYEKLQLQFEPESIPHNINCSISLRPSIMNLGSEGGWSEVNDAVTAPPVGVRSPADGQADDDDTPSCAPLPPSSTFDAPSTSRQIGGNTPKLQWDPPSKSNEKNSTINLPNVAMSTAPMPPLNAPLTAAVFPLPNVPLAAEALPIPNVTSTAATLPLPNVTLVAAESLPLLRNPDGSECVENENALISGDPSTGSPSHFPDIATHTQPILQPDLGNQDESSLSNSNLNMVRSCPLDVLPSKLLPDIGNNSNSDAMHPDVLGRLSINPNLSSNHHVSEDQYLQEDSIQITDQEVDPLPQILQEHRLLPDLMSMDGGSFSPVDEPLNDFPEPAIIVENTRQNIGNRDPSIVIESRSCSRIPEIVNVHQTQENGSQLEVNSTLNQSNDIPECSTRNNFDAVDNNIAEVHLYNTRERGLNLPDISDVKPIEIRQQDATIDIDPNPISIQPQDAINKVNPVSFQPRDDISDADLDAELAELEEEQARLHGAYNQNSFLSLPQSNVSQSVENETSEPDVINVATLQDLSENDGNNEENEVASQPELESLDDKCVTEESNCCGLDNLEEPNKSELMVQGENLPKLESDVSANSPEGVSDERNPSDELSNSSSSSDTPSSNSTLIEDEITAQGISEDVNPTQSSDSEGLSSTPIQVPEEDSGSGHEEASEESGSTHRPIDNSEASSIPPNVPARSSIGLVAPFWIPDEEAQYCQECWAKFTVIKRRHHCRGCGRVLCSSCCHEKARMPYMDYKMARVCATCLQIINSDEDESSPADSGTTARAPDPNNPMDYCSRIPPPQQAAAGGPPPTVMVPVGVLKRGGGTVYRGGGRGSKQVIFSDGIRPGGDLTELDGSQDTPPLYRSRISRSRQVQAFTPEYIFEDKADTAHLEEQMKGTGPPVVFSITKNFSVLVKHVKLDCCVGLEVWNVATRGLCTVGQDEIVVLLEVAPGETRPPKQLFSFFHTVYQQANRGNLVGDMSHTIFTEPEGFLGSRDHAGFVYVRPTFQCLQNLVLPPLPYIFAVLILKWETPWAKVFPLRLLLRLGAEFRYYPCPLVSSRNRKPVFGEIGHTIMNLLIDFRNFSYTVPVINGFLIHMEEKKFTLLLPENRYEQVNKALNNSNDCVLALGGNFSPHADSHLVTIENDDGHYTTQAINIHNRTRKVTGASFIVFNGALKTNCGLTAKSSIVEDGLMVQISSDMMVKLRDALRNMNNFDIACGPASSKEAEEFVLIRWVQDDANFNIGIKSVIDNKAMDGIPSVKIQAGHDLLSGEHIIRWTEIFIIGGDQQNGNNDVNLNRLFDVLARAFMMGLTSHLAFLYGESLTKIALRTTLHQDSVEYEAGSDTKRLPSHCMKDLDTELIPVLHRAAAAITGDPIILELIFNLILQ